MSSPVTEAPAFLVRASGSVGTQSTDLDLPPDVVPEASTEPLEPDLNSRSLEIKVEAELEAALLYELRALVLKLLNQGVQLEVVRDRVRQIGASYSQHIQQIQRDPTSSERSNAGPNNAAIEQGPDFEEQTAVRAPDNMHGSQDQSGTPSSRVM